MQILLIDDHPLFRSGIAAVVAELAAAIQCIEVSRCEEALRLIACGAQFELILLDLNLPGMDGLTGLAKLRDATPSTPIVMLSASENAAKIKQAINAGAMGYIPKSSSRDIILNALRLALAGGVYLPRNLTHTAAESGEKESDVNGHGLTARQHEVINLVAMGKSNKEIAYRLGMAENTVRVHVAAILKLLNVKNRTEAGYAATQRGLIGDVN